MPHDTPRLIRTTPVGLIEWIFKHWLGWDGVTALATLMLVFVGLATVIYAGMQLTDFRNEARIKHVIDLVQQFESEPLATYRRTLGERRISNGILQPLDVENPPPELHDVMNFFEHVGFLLKGNYVDLESVLVEFHYWILHIWTDAQQVVQREQAEEPVYYEHFVEMVRKLEQHERERTGRLTMPTLADVQDFYIEEARLRPGSPIPRQKRRKKRP